MVLLPRLKPELGDAISATGAVFVALRARLDDGAGPARHGAHAAGARQHGPHARLSVAGAGDPGLAAGIDRDELVRVGGAAGPAARQHGCDPLRPGLARRISDAAGAGADRHARRRSRRASRFSCGATRAACGRSRSCARRSSAARSCWRCRSRPCCPRRRAAPSPTTLPGRTSQRCWSPPSLPPAAIRHRSPVCQFLPLRLFAAATLTLSRELPAGKPARRRRGCRNQRGAHGC